jgi:hypothetical protein
LVHRKVIGKKLIKNLNLQRIVVMLHRLEIRELLDVVAALMMVVEVVLHLVVQVAMDVVVKDGVVDVVNEVLVDHHSKVQNQQTKKYLQ